ncbi:MAG: AGE family epimerase/isomerase, partial [bacterium]
ITGPAPVRTKTWWAQAELLVGLLAVHERTGDPKYFDVFEHELRWIFNNLVDDEFGSWYPTVGANGTVTETWKASPWKGPYHDGRACLESIRRLGMIARSGR